MLTKTADGYGCLFKALYHCDMISMSLSVLYVVSIVNSYINFYFNIISKTPVSVSCQNNNYILFIIGPDDIVSFIYKCNLKFVFL